MTQEEKIKEAKKLYETANADQRYVLESLFPELKESEDERIRKELLNAFQESEDSLYMVLTPHKRESFIAWIEKQGEHNSFSWTEDDEAKVKAMCEEGNLKPSEREWLNNLRYRVTEHKPTDKYEPMSLDEAIKHCKEKSCGNNACALEHKQLEKWLTELKELKEQKPAEWSEIDKANLEDSIYFVKEFRRSNLCDNESRLQNSRTCIEWLASLKDRVLPQPKQEWSEEDRKIIIELIGIFESAVDGGHVSFPYRLIKDYIRVLKSCLSQSTWKPSDDEMKALAEALSLANNCGEEYAFDLRTLQDQLKKLK